jgi:hypothetical protein
MKFLRLQYYYWDSGRPQFWPIRRTGKGSPVSLRFLTRPLAWDDYSFMMSTSSNKYVRGGFQTFSGPWSIRVSTVFSSSSDPRFAGYDHLMIHLKSWASKLFSADSIQRAPLPNLHHRMDTNMISSSPIPAILAGPICSSSEVNQRDSSVLVFLLPSL